MPTDIDTGFRGYPLPFIANNLSHDVLRLIAAIDAIDADVNAILLALAGKANSVHTHALSDVTGLVTALADLQAAIDALPGTDTLAGLSDTTIVTPTTGQLIVRDASGKWVNVAASASLITSGEFAEARMPSYLKIASLAAKLDASAFTAAAILTMLKTVDGATSGLDADLLRGTTPAAKGLEVLAGADALAIRTLIDVYSKSEVDEAAGPSVAVSNLLINGDGKVNQRGVTTGLADGTYGFDRHVMLSQTAPINIAQITPFASNMASCMMLTQPQATAQRMGAAQLIPANVTWDLRGKTVTLGGRARLQSAGTIRYAILEHTGTADSPPLDPINNWASTNYTAGNFFKSTDLTVRATGSIAVTGATWTYFSLSADIGASANNVIVVIWAGDAVAQNKYLQFRWHFVEGDLTAVEEPVTWNSLPEELRLCTHYFRKLTDGIASGYDTNNAIISVPFHDAPMRAAPTCTMLSVGSLVSNGATRSVSGISAFNLAATAVHFDIDGTSLSGAVAYNWRGGVIHMDAEIGV